MSHSLSSDLSDESSRKGKCPGSLSASLSCNEIRVDFQYFTASCSAAGHSSSSSHSHSLKSHRSCSSAGRSDLLPLPIQIVNSHPGETGLLHLPNQLTLFFPYHLAWPASPAHSAQHVWPVPRLPGQTSLLLLFALTVMPLLVNHPSLAYLPDPAHQLDHLTLGLPLTQAVWVPYPLRQVSLILAFFTCFSW